MWGCPLLKHAFMRFIYLRSSSRLSSTRIVFWGMYWDCRTTAQTRNKNALVMSHTTESPAVWSPDLRSLVQKPSSRVSTQALRWFQGSYFPQSLLKVLHRETRDISLLIRESWEAPLNKIPVCLCPQCGYVAWLCHWKWFQYNGIYI